MLTERGIRVINKMQNEGHGCNQNCQHVPLYQIIKNVYLCNGPVSLDQLKMHKFTHLVNIDHEWFQNNRIPAASSVDANDPSVEFELLNLHFGEPFRMKVLPNVYLAVKFLEKALANSGKVLIGEEMGLQKTLTIVIAYIMYHFRLKFLESLQIVGRLCTVNFDLDTHLMAQLNEYEPILQTQQRALLGSSCSGELRSARLKRKVQDSPIKVTPHPDVIVDFTSSNNPTTNGLTVVQKMET